MVARTMMELKRNTRLVLLEQLLGLISRVGLLGCARMTGTGRRVVVAGGVRYAGYGCQATDGS
jgi:hypothetical protein